MTATNVSLQDPFGLARVTLYKRPSDANAYINNVSNERPAGHLIEEPEEEEQEGAHSSAVMSGAAQYEQQLLNHITGSDGDDCR